MRVDQQNAPWTCRKSCAAPSPGGGDAYPCSLAQHLSSLEQRACFQKRHARRRSRSRVIAARCRWVSGAEDEIWPSDRYEHIIMRELRADPALHVHLNYAHAGHADLAQPYIPIRLQSDDHGRIVSLGGTAAGYEQPHEHDWPALMRFMTAHSPSARERHPSMASAQQELACHSGGNHRVEQRQARLSARAPSSRSARPAQGRRVARASAWSVRRLYRYASTRPDPQAGPTSSLYIPIVSVSGLPPNSR